MSPRRHLPTVPTLTLIQGIYRVNRDTGTPEFLAAVDFNTPDNPFIASRMVDAIISLFPDDAFMVVDHSSLKVMADFKP